jgi:uncharacterized membrane protein
MNKERLTAFTDGVLAIVITIMVLELKVPHDTSLAALAGVWPVFLSYVLSFIYVAIYWNNHHHFFQLVPRIGGGVLWANIHLLFWLSLTPFATAWMGENHFAPLPTALYGFVLAMCALAWALMQGVILRMQGPDSPLRHAIGRDLKGRVSPFLYVAGIGSSFFTPLVGLAFYAAVAFMWLIPDRRIERAVAGQHKNKG